MVNRLESPACGRGFHFRQAPLPPEHLQGFFVNPVEKIQWIMTQDYGFHLWNYVSSLGAYLAGASTILFVFIVFYTLFFGRRVGDNYWNNGPQSMTFEWTLSSPPPFHQFEVQPTVK